MRRHIFFTGFMASGKSRTGRALAERLERPFIDTDSLIVERVGKSISEIFAQEGEAFSGRRKKKSSLKSAVTKLPRWFP